MKLDYSFHSHTFRCGHAEDDIEDYVKIAIENKFRIYGVSDHVFLPGVSQYGTRGEYSLLDDYIDKFNASKKLHEKEIKMYLGFECEYSDTFAEYYKYLLKEKGFDFLICGQHNGFDASKNIYSYFGDESHLLRCKKDIIDAMKSGLFLYIAHPDIFFVCATEISDFLKEITKEIIAAAIKYDAVLELNRHGFLREHHRNGQTYIDYPCEYFWKEVAKTNIKVVVGGDYHSKNEIFNKEAEDRLNELINKCKITLSNIDDIYLKYRQRIKKQLLI